VERLPQNQLPTAKPAKNAAKVAPAACDVFPNNSPNCFIHKI
jgi:hypothetical protein